MQGQNQSYLDLSVIKELRKHVLSQDAVVLFNQDINKIIWANASGAQLFGGRGVVDLLSASISDSQSIVRQLKESIHQIEGNKSIIRGFRINQGLRSLLIQFEIKRIKILDGQFGYKITNFSSKSEITSENVLAENAVETLNSFADAAAILDDFGTPLSASSNFIEFGPSKDTLSSLVSELKNEADRLIKRPEKNLDGQQIAIGLARISNTPGRNLIVIAKTQEEEINTTSELQTNNTNPSLDDNIDATEATPISENSNPIAMDNSAEAVMADIAHELNVAKNTQQTADVTQEQELEAPSELVDPKTVKPFNYDVAKNDGTVRFAWVIDENRVFKSTSPELAETVGPNAAAVIDREWRDVANVFGFDTSREIEKLLNKHDTWSGKTVLWPVEGTDMVLPIDLAALPSFNSNREFEGFRGFGIIRTADALVDPDEVGLALSPTVKTEIEEDIKPQTSNENAQDQETNIVRLVPRSSSAEQPSLSEQENNAFKKIGDTLREQNNTKLSPIENQEQIERAFKSSAEPEIKITLELEDIPEMDIVLELETEVDDDSSSFNHPQENDSDIDEVLKNTNSDGLDVSIMEKLPVPIVIYNSEEILFGNQSLFEATGYENNKELEEIGGIEAILAPIVSDGEDTAPKYHLTTKLGTKTRVNPILNSVSWAGEKALLISFSTAQEVHKQEPPAIEISNVSEIQNILDITSDGILVIDHEGIIISINASAEALFNVSFDQAAGNNITTLFATESRNTIRQYIESHSTPSLDTMFGDGKEVIASEANGGMIPVFITVSKMQSSGKLCAVIRDMTSWKRAEEELIQSRHEAETMSTQKSDFLAHISHEIRTPLNSIIGFSDIMIEERFGPVKNERYREYLRDINRSGTHVLDLINDLLDLSKIESGKLELEFEAVDLNELVAESVAILQPQANTNRIIIRTSLSRSVPKVVADIRSIRQIILNLVSNAIKFSPTNSQVIVSTVYESNGEVALRIRDTGNGMSEAEIEEALKPFHQIHTTGQNRNEGSGLGLPLTKALVEANRALFDLESDPGQGTIAHVQFPTQRVLAD